MKRRALGRCGSVTIVGKPLISNVAERENWLDLFASRLERGFNVERSAAAIGKSPSWGTNALREISRRLGPQSTELDLGWRPTAERKAA